MGVAHAGNLPSLDTASFPQQTHFTRSCFNFSWRKTCGFKETICH